jgi:RND family efflux transporter MFP subunit
MIMSTPCNAILCIALLASLAACGQGSAAAATASATPATVIVGVENSTVVQRGRLETGPMLIGTLAAEHDATIRALVAGPVLAIFADVGVRVSKGQLLTQLDDQPLQDALASARSAMHAAEAAAGNARRELSRQQQLLSVEAVATHDVETARSADANAAANLADARSRLSTVQQQLRYVHVTAPIDGVVSARNVSTGDMIAVGGALFTIVDPSVLRLVASVPAEGLADVRVGLPVTFTVRGYGSRSFTGRIARVSPAADPATRQVSVYATIPSAGQLVTGLFATGRVRSHTVEGLVVPTTALDARAVTPAVVRLRAGRIERVRVQVSARDEATQRVIVVGALNAGDTLLTGAAQQIAETMRVTVMRADERLHTSPLH